MREENKKGLGEVWQFCLLMCAAIEFGYASSRIQGVKLKFSRVKMCMALLKELKKGFG